MTSCTAMPSGPPCPPRCGRPRSAATASASGSRWKTPGCQWRLVVATVEDRPHVHLYRLWEAPEGARDWRVPVVQVEDAIRAAAVRWRVLEVAADPYRWQRSLEVLNGELTHDGDPRLARHVANTILKADSRGARLAKEHKDSRRRSECRHGSTPRRRAGRHDPGHLCLSMLRPRVRPSSRGRSQGHAALGAGPLRSTAEKVRG
jgi:hypothetical protein